MKAFFPNFRTSLFVLFGLLVSCASDVDYSHLERDPEALGQRTGRADAYAGRDDDYSRHLDELHPDADEDDFEDAYDDAYEEAEEEIEEREEREEERRDRRDASTQRTYDDGYEQGELDRHRGLSRNPRRHDAYSGSSSISRAWTEGYEDGWNGD
ncbi:MAG: hypothetical protein KDN20_19000 [Verrucomicrobiae bacterium]|nr:hypothetical protein [Verrucomicrobiae bacterium]